MVIFIVDDLGCRGPGIPDLTEVCQHQKQCPHAWKSDQQVCVTPPHRASAAQNRILGLKSSRSVVSRSLTCRSLKGVFRGLCVRHFSHYILCCDIVNHLKGSFGLFGPKSKTGLKGVPGPFCSGGSKKVSKESKMNLFVFSIFFSDFDSISESSFLPFGPPLPRPQEPLSRLFSGSGQKARMTL